MGPAGAGGGQAGCAGQCCVLRALHVLHGRAWDVCCVLAEDAWPQGGRLTTPCLLPFQKPFAWPVAGAPERAAAEFFLGCLILSSLSPVFLLF